MKLHGAPIDVQGSGNLLGSHTERQKRKNFDFPPRQGHQRRGRFSWAALVSHGGYYRPNSIALKIIASALAEP